MKATPFQPVLCQQCGHAPCEPVCPVYASVHSEAEQTNLQVYNRCVGTRYCANNCPYQVRAFNWRDFSRPEPLPNQLHPDVTVRRRGVMEKCTFCLQRILKAEDRANSEDRPLKAGEATTACSQVCPTGAIVFGRLDDPESLVSHLAKDGRGIQLLEELGTLPSVTYLKGGHQWSQRLNLERVHQEEDEDPREHLMLDPKPRGEMNAMVMDSMHATSWKFWL